MQTHLKTYLLWSHPYMECSMVTMCHNPHAIVREDAAKESKCVATNLSHSSLVRTRYTCITVLDDVMLP